MNQLTRPPWPSSPLALLMLVAGARVLAAQPPATCPATAAPIREICQVDQAPIPAPDRALPRYPDILRSARVGGVVRVRYVVDSTGRVPKVVVVHATHDLFASAVRFAVSRWTFTPARLADQPVPVWREEVFSFDANNDSLAEFGDWTATILRDITTDGVPRTRFGFASRDSAADAVFSPEDLLRAQRNVLAAIVSEYANGPRGELGDGVDHTLCVSINVNGSVVPADSGTLRLVSTPRRRAVRPAECPPSYASMAVVVDSAGRAVSLAPPGWHDPFGLKVNGVVAWRPDIVLVRAQFGQSLWQHMYECLARRSGGEWNARCIRGRSILH